MKRTKRVLLFPNSNTFSHVARALQLCRWLEEADYEPHIGVAESRCRWAAQHHPKCHVVREIWEPSRVSYPCPRWFSSGEHVEACVDSQEKLIALVRPDLIVGIFDFACAVSRGAIPTLTINGACMLPGYNGVLGFDDEASPLREEQKRVLDMFWAYAGRSFERALEARGMTPARDARELLAGNMSLIYEIEEICGRVTPPHHCVGPIFWDGWEKVGEGVPWRRETGIRTVYLNAGTLPIPGDMADAIIDDCVTDGLRVIVSSGVGAGPLRAGDRIYSRPLIQPSAALSVADASICSGGIGSCYANLFYGVPSLVIPMQPEQATNGLNLRKSGCAEVYRHNVVFYGDARQFCQPFDRQRVRALLGQILGNLEARRATARFMEIVRQHDTRVRILPFVRDIL